MLQCSGANCSVMVMPANNTRYAVISTHRPGKDSPRLRGARGWTSGQAIAASCVQQKSVPSVQMQCRMTASLRATATLAFLAPTRFMSRTPRFQRRPALDLGQQHARRLVETRPYEAVAAFMEWFFRLKLHFVVNHKGQIMALRITPGNIADSTVLDEITQHLTGKLYADKGYISREMFRRLWQRGLHLITGIRRNMRNHLMPLADKLMLRKRFVIETVLDILKCEMGLEHSRHR